LKERYKHIERLDGDIMRNHLSILGFSKEDRDANIKRVGFVASLLSRNGVIVVASFISPYKAHREDLKKNVHGFLEVHVHAPLAVCEKRDPKGMYKKARKGEIENFTGIDDPYETPETPDLKIETHLCTVKESVSKVIKFLEDEKYIF